MKFHQIRNATAIIHYAGKKILIDPMLSAKGSFPGFPLTMNRHLRNPLVDLPLPVSEVIDVDAIIVTHTHDDHWDAAARALIPRDMLIFVQNTEDKNELARDGFINLQVLDNEIEYAAAAELLGEAMGVILQSDGEKTIYIVGDTIWINDVEQVMHKYQPDIVILNTGYAQVENLGPIIMGKEDVLRTHNILPKAHIISTHMESVNHFGQTRKEIREYVDLYKITDQVSIPEDGEVVNL